MRGAADPLFAKRATNFIYRFRQRHEKVWRATTTMGSKNMPGRYTKWKALATFVYNKTRGIALEHFGIADETAMRKEIVSRKQLASKGAKRVPAATSGDERVCTTVFPFVTGKCEKLPLLIIDKGAIAPNRPDFRGKRNPKSIRAKVDAAIAAGKFCAPFFLWINKDGKMEEECMTFCYKEIWNKRPGNDPLNPTPSFTLMDAYASHRTDRVINYMHTLKVCPGIIPGGGTADMQVHDKHIIKRLKREHAILNLRARREKYNTALRRLQGAMGNSAPHRIPIPKLTRIEHYQNLVQAWEKVYVGDLHDLLPDVKVMPYELAVEKQWTPDKAFAEFEEIIEQEQMQDAVALQTVGAPLSTIAASQSQIDPTRSTSAQPKKYKCLVSGCKARASFGNEGNLPDYCATHKQAGSAHLVSSAKRGKGTCKSATIQTKLVTFLKPATSQCFEEKTESQCGNPNTLTLGSQKSAVRSPSALTRTSPDSEETEDESPALVCTNRKSESHVCSKVAGVLFESDTESDATQYPEQEEIEVAVQLSIKKEPTTPKKSIQTKPALMQ